MAKSSVGLKKIEIADPVSSGLPETWVEIEAAQIGSWSLTETEPTKTILRVEQKPNSVFRELTTEPGIENLAGEIYDLSADTMLAVKGGAVTGDGTSTPKQWGKSETLSTIMKAVRVTTFDDHVIVFPNASVQATFNWPLTVGDAGRIALSFTPQAPLDDSLQEVMISEPLPA